MAKDTLDLLSKLITQSDNASTDAERDSFLEKAMELSSKASIDLAVARAHAKNKHKEKPEERQILVNPFGRKYYRNFFMDLFLAIAEANDCKSMIGGRSYYAYAYGFPSDINVTEALYATLAIQMITDCDKALKRGDHKEKYTVEEQVMDPYTRKPVLDPTGQPVVKKIQREWSAVDGKVFRQNFYKGFIARTSSRLWEAKRKAEAAVKATTTDDGTEVGIVLADKKTAVEERYQREEERLKQLNPRGLGSYSGAKPSRNSHLGKELGQAAAARAKHGTEDGSTLAAAAPKKALK